MPRDSEDLERVRNAIRSGVQPIQVQMRDPTTRRGLHPAIIAYEADGGVLELAKHGRVTRLGRLWDQERARSRSPRSQTAGQAYCVHKNAPERREVL